VVIFVFFVLGFCVVVFFFVWGFVFFFFFVFFFVCFFFFLCVFFFFFCCGVLVIFLLSPRELSVEGKDVKRCPFLQTSFPLVAPRGFFSLLCFSNPNKITI